MSYFDLNDEEIAQRGKAIYDRHIRGKVETEENIGKMIAIDLQSGEYEIDTDPNEARRRLQERHHNIVPWTAQIGINTVHHLGEVLIHSAEHTSGLSSVS
jgi:hypothetical protein